MSAADLDPSQARVRELEALVARMRSELTATSEKLTAANDRLAGVVDERDNLRRAYRQLMEQFELLRRRIFIAKAERVDASQLELEFEKTKQKLDALARRLEDETDEDASADRDANTVGSKPAGKQPSGGKKPPKGRRNLADDDHLPQRRIEIRDHELEQGGATFVDWELSYKLGYQRPSEVRVVIARQVQGRQARARAMSVTAKFDGVRVALFDGQNGRSWQGSRPMASSTAAL